MLLSIIVPIYNKENYIERCIESIINQNYPAKEIVLVDDGSTDTSGIICDVFAQNYDNIVVLHTENMGLLHARYNGILVARGEYVTFVDADDWIAPNMYGAMLSQIESYDMIACQINRYFSEDNVISDQLVFDSGVYKKEGISNSILPRMLWDSTINRWALDPSLCSKIFKKDKLLTQFENVNNLDCYYGEDSVITYPFLLQADSVRLLSECFYYHRQRGKGEIPSYIKDEQFVDKTYRVYQYLKDVFKKSSYWDILEAQLEHFFVNSISLKNMCFHEKTGEICPIFPFIDVKQIDKVILYGAGKLGKAYMKQNEEQHFCNIVLWVDRNCGKINVPGYEIVGLDKIETVAFDYIIIAIDVRDTAYKVKQELMEKGIREDQIIWHSIRRDKF